MNYLVGNSPLSDSEFFLALRFAVILLIKVCSVIKINPTSLHTNWLMDFLRRLERGSCHCHLIIKGNYVEKVAANQITN